MQAGTGLGRSKFGDFILQKQLLALHRGDFAIILVSMCHLGRNGLFEGRMLTFQLCEMRFHRHTVTS